MARYVQLMSASLLLALVVGVVLLNLSFAANWDYRVALYHLLSAGVLIPFGPWCGASCFLLTGMFLVSSLSTGR